MCLHVAVSGSDWSCCGRGEDQSGDPGGLRIKPLLQQETSVRRWRAVPPGGRPRWCSSSTSEGPDQSTWSIAASNWTTWNTSTCWSLRCGSDQSHWSVELCSSLSYNMNDFRLMKTWLLFITAAELNLWSDQWSSHWSILPSLLIWVFMCSRNRCSPAFNHFIVFILFFQTLIDYSGCYW